MNRSDRSRTARVHGAAAAPARLLLLALAVWSAGCSGIQSAVNPYGPQAERIAWLWWLFFSVCTAVLLAVTAAVLLAAFRPGRRHVESVPPEGEPRKQRIVIAATILTVLILVMFFAADLRVGTRMTAAPAAEARPVAVEVVGHQWWWEIQYLDSSPDRSFRTANELRIPVGRPVVIQTTSRDVIHSFWVPNLHGKIDLIPGRVNTIWLQADRPGVFRGQCAEFCGLQHAKMAFTVVAVPDAEFERWLQAARRPAPPPRTPEARRGEQVFLQAQCSMCHTIRGTGAWGRVAPDLTRLAERRTIAAGTLPNTRGHLAGWILDPQQVKPGNFMPPTSLDPDSLHALLAYLETLQ